MALPTVHRDEVDGVPVFWVESGRPTLGAVLVFRCGIVDETLPTTGWTHLVEHLALHGREHGALHVNGSTSLLRTTVETHGPAADVTRALAEVTAWLADPDLARVDAESRVLHAEAEFRGNGDGPIAMLQRFGARGPGLAGYTEPGLSRASADRLAQHVRRRFTTGNAALVLDGAPPAGLRLHLPTGPGLPLPPTPTSADPRPAAYGTSGRLVLSGEVPRVHAATLLPAVLQRRLREDLRESAGGAYAPWASYEAVGPDTAVVLAGSDVSQGLLPSVAAEVMSTLAAIHAEGPQDGVLDDVIAQTIQAMRDPYQAVGFAYGQAVALLEAQPVEPPEEAVEQIASVTREDVTDLLEEWAGSLLVGMPGDAAWDDQLPTLRMPTHETASAGSRFRFGNFPAARQELVVGDHVVEVGEPARWQRMRFDEVVGVFAAADGGRTLIDADGWSLHVEPTMWRRGADAVQRIDALVPADRHIPFPAREPGSIPRPLAWYRRWGSAALTVDWAWPLLVVVVVTGLAIAGVVPPRLILTTAIVGAGSVWFWRRQERRKRGNGSS